MTSTINGLERKIQTLHFVSIVLEISAKDIRHMEKTASLSNISLLLTSHQDQSDQKGRDSNEPASKERTSNEPAKKKSSVDQLVIRWVVNLVTSKYSMNSSFLLRRISHGHLQKLAASLGRISKEVISKVFYRD